MQNSDNLKRCRLWPVDKAVIGVAGQCPETKGTGCKVGPGMAAHGRVGKEFASVENRLFHAVGGFLVVVCNVRPNIENIRFGKRRKSIAAHRLDKRQSSFIP